MAVKSKTTKTTNRKPTKTRAQALVAGRKELLGIGDIVLSPLPWAAFQNQHGGPPPAGVEPNWVPCDGNAYPSSAFAAAMGRSDVPNFLGRYPRGADNTYAPFTLLDDQIQQHTHSHDNWGVMGDCEGGGNNQVLRTGYGGTFRSSGVEGARVGAETRPKTTVMNFYIRIN